MKMDLLTQSIVGAVANDLLSLLRDALKKSFYCKSYCKRLQKTLEEVIPVLDEVFTTGSEQFSQHRLKKLAEFHERLKNGTELVKSCSSIRRYNIYQNHKYAKKILALEKYINNFNSKQGWVHTLCDVQHLRGDVREGVDRILQQIREGQESPLPQQMMIDQMGLLQIDEKMTNSSLQIPDLPEFPVGLQISVDELRKRLFLKDISPLAVKGMGGSGKTTLAIALCNDPAIKGYFKDRIIFITVSQSPNLKGIIERMWDKIVRSRRPDFLGVEDARMQFQQGLRQSKSGPTLVVLDDVWKKDHLEKLLFKAEGYKTVITTRNSIVTTNCQYDLQLLSEADALSLFCFWAFKQETIPEAQDEDLVKQVVAECKGLPLALKVIGSSLHNKCPAVWKDGRVRLSRAQSISDYHKEGLLKCIETSVDMLEEEVRECFLDLGSFPEDRKNSVAALLDLWVYVRELDWEAAYTNLIELKSRNLVTLVDSPMDRFGNLYSSSCEHFIQHDVLRDLAIYSTDKELINRRKRLIMPRMENSLPPQWKKYADCALDAEIVSLHT
ncbi:hypothetical protein KI387_012966, partial [Taxus chinensis]